MTAQELQEQLHTKIPMSAAMGVTVLEASWERVRLGAPLETNINHQGSAFGGSVAAVAMLAGWSMAHLRVHAAEPSARVVIHSEQTTFDSPVLSDYEAVCVSPPDRAWTRLERAIRRGRAGRVDLQVSVMADGVVAAQFEGRYAALSSRKAFALDGASS